MANDKLKAALTKAMMPEYDVVVYDYEEHTFSYEFEKKMEKLINLRNKPYYHMVNTIWKKAVCMVVCIFIASSVTIFSVEAFREPFVDFIVDTYERFSHVETTENENTPSTLESIYAITYDLSGFDIDYEYRDVRRYDVTYVNNDIYIYFTQLLKGNNFSINTENTDISRIYINGHEAMYFLDNHDYHNIIWDTGEYIISLGSNIGKDELISIAESVQK